MRANRQVGPGRTTSFLARNPIFRLQDLAQELGLSRNHEAALERIKYHLGQGRIKAVTKGVYATVPPGLDAARFQPDRYLVGAAIRPDAIFSHHAALELLGVAHSTWSQCTILTERRGRPVRFGEVEIRLLQHPAALRRTGKLDLGVQEVDRLGRRLRVTGAERTLLDGFMKPALVGGLEELVESAAGFGVLDLELLKRLLEVHGQKVLWGAAGWFLEQYRHTFYVPDAYLAALEKERPRSPQYLPRSRPPGGVFLSRWNVVLPRTVTRPGEPDDTGA